MKRTSLAVLMIALALVALAAPAAFAQAPAPKVTINGLIDNVTSASWNVHNYNGLWNRKDSQWYARTRGRFDIVGEVGKAKGVLAIEIDSTWGQTGSADNAGQQAFGTTSSWDLNTDTRGVIEIKWLYTELPVPFMPVPTTVRLGAQPSGAAATYKLASYFNGDFAGLNAVVAATPNVKILATYVAVEEGLTGTNTKTGFPIIASNPLATEDRGDDWAYIFSAEVTPFKGLDIKPMFSGFHAQGTTSGSARAGRGGINTSTAFSPVGGHLGNMNEARYTVGLDARLRIGPFSLDPTVHYQFGHRRVITPAGFEASGAVAGQRRKADISAWLLDVRAGFQLGPLLLQGVGVYTTGNSARNNTLGTVRYYQPLSTDTGYLADWGTQLTSLGIDYLSAMNEAGRFVAYPGAHIGWDKYGRAQLGLKATYAITPSLSAMAGGNLHWTAEGVDRNGTPTAAAGILPSFTGGPRGKNSGWGFGSDRFIGTELMALISWRFAPGLSWDNAAGYMFAGPALDAITLDTQGPRNAKDSAIVVSRVRFTF
ncbi:MAG: hypothetical protein ACREJS_04485 [Candidatus Rokuibacteriota bacterium]